MNPLVAAGTILAVAAAFLSRPASGQRLPQPIIDMHMHALAADEQGPPPLGMCTPFPEYATWDPRTSFPELFLSKFKKPACPDPVWSPMTDDVQSLVDAGFGARVMSGSDQMVWPGTIERAIAVIEEAPFLSAAQKRDIFYNNAARFLRLQR